MSKIKTVLLIGCGQMGKSLLGGWITHGFTEDRLWVVEPDVKRLNDIPISNKVANKTSLPIDLRPNVIVIATKPQSVEDVVESYRYFSEGAVFLSIVAGKSIRWLENKLGSASAVVRAMPNIPASVGSGITVACSNNRLDAIGYANCTNLLEAVGSVVWINQEELMDAVTAVSGSGPAYILLLTEALEKAGQSSGLPANLAQHLARMTLIGTGKLLSCTEDSMTTVRRNVTSPGGTTAAAIRILEDPHNGINPLIMQAVAAAIARSKELG